jgi:hypothetical protein
MFRLSDEEFQRLQKMCLSTNHRSFSEMVRAAVQFWLTSGAGQSKDGLDHRIRDLERRVSHLADKVQELVKFTPANVTL